MVVITHITPQNTYKTKIEAFPVSGIISLISANEEANKVPPPHDCGPQTILIRKRLEDC